MPIIVGNHTTVFEGDSTRLFQLMAIRGALRLESVGMRASRGGDAVKAAIRVLESIGRDVTKEKGWPNTRRARASFLYEAIDAQYKAEKESSVVIDRTTTQ
jgi:hypothetical protein